MAEQKTFYLTIARVDGPVYDADAISVHVPGSEGDMTILAGHEALISSLKAGTISVIRADNSIESFEVVSGGTVEISD
ncbi:MAG: F0F1 ATP synthase subunit epsilon, partial [Candidatus Paceibacterota bacterium]